MKSGKSRDALEECTFAANEISIVSTRKIYLGDEVNLFNTVQLAPNSSVSIKTSGTPGATVTLRLERVPNTGGHFHGGATNLQDAVGIVTPSSFTLPGTYPQNVRSVYKAPQVSGVVKFIASFSAGPPVEHRLEVMLPGLHAIVETQNLRLKSPTSIHPSPYWALPEFILKLNQLADGYAARTGKYLTLTDASLEWGGRFDLGSDWTAPHSEHFRGREADLRSSDMSEDEKNIFEETVKSLGLTVLEEANHWHVRF